MWMEPGTGEFKKEGDINTIERSRKIINLVIRMSMRGFKTGKNYVILFFAA